MKTVLKSLFFMILLLSASCTENKPAEYSQYKVELYAFLKDNGGQGEVNDDTVFVWARNDSEAYYQAYKFERRIIRPWERGCEKRGVTPITKNINLTVRNKEGTEILFPLSNKTKEQIEKQVRIAIGDTEKVDSPKSL